MNSWFRDFFIPHAGNDYKPHSLQRAAMLGMVFLVLLSFTIANVQSFLWITSDWMVSTILPSVIVDLTNEERAENGQLPSLRHNVVLDAAAQLKAADMARNQYFAHYSPTGVSPWHWFSEARYDFVHAGENLAIHFVDSDEVVKAWMNSPSHRDNILNGNFTEIGVGAAEGTYDGYRTVYVVQLFGTPAAQQVVATPEPAPVVSAAAQTPVVTEIDPEYTPQIAGSEDVSTDVDDTEVTLISDRDPVTVASDTETEIAEVVVNEDNTVSLYSDLVSTSTGGVPATIDPNETVAPTDPVVAVAAIGTKPQLVLQVLYLLIALFVLGALALSIFIEIKRQHPVQIAYSAGLVAVMALLLYVHMSVTSGAVVV